MLYKIKEDAEKFFSNKSFSTEEMYERINTQSYLWQYVLLDCIKEIPQDEQMDKWFIYGDTCVDYLTAIVASYLQNYIKKNCKRWKSHLTDFNWNVLI